MCNLGLLKENFWNQRILTRFANIRDLERQKYAFRDSSNYSFLKRKLNFFFTQGIQNQENRQAQWKHELTFFILDSNSCLIWYQTQYHNLTQSDKPIIKRYVIMIQTSFGTFKFGGKWERSAYTSNHWLEANDWRIGLSIYLEEEEKHIWICCYYYYCWCVQVWTV